VWAGIWHEAYQFIVEDQLHIFPETRINYHLVVMRPEHQENNAICQDLLKEK